MELEIRERVLIVAIDLVEPIVLRCGFTMGLCPMSWEGAAYMGF